MVSAMTDRTIDDDAGLSEADEAPPPAKPSRLKLVILIAGPLAALLVVVGGLWLTGIWPFSKGGASHAAEVKAPPRQTAFLELPEMLVNLSASGRKTSFLKLSIQLELESPEEVNKVKTVLPRLVDNFQVYLRELRVEDLKGSAGMYRLREELLGRVNAAAAPVKVVDVLFKEMLVQ